jgi:hypothetical protein
MYFTKRLKTVPFFCLFTCEGDGFTEALRLEHRSDSHLSHFSWRRGKHVLTEMEASKGLPYQLLEQKFSYKLLLSAAAFVLYVV